MGYNTKEKRNAWARQHRKANPEQYREIDKKKNVRYKAKHGPVRVKPGRSKKRACKKSEHELRTRKREKAQFQVFEARMILGHKLWGGICNYCAMPMDQHNCWAFDIDHIEPISMGGVTALDKGGWRHWYRAFMTLSAEFGEQEACKTLQQNTQMLCCNCHMIKTRFHDLPASWAAKFEPVQSKLCFHASVKQHDLFGQKVL